jgi:hypothetical protein
MEFILFDNELRKFHTLGINRKCFDFLINGCNIYHILEMDDVFNFIQNFITICVYSINSDVAFAIINSLNNRFLSL